jgi:putative phage-type endonuclease
MSTREEWLAERSTYLGASDGPTVLGINPFKTPYQLWAEKTGAAEPEDLSDKECVEFGNRLERPVAEAFGDRTGRHVEMWTRHLLLRDTARSYVGCTPDATQMCPVRGPGNLQIKTTNEFAAKDWKKEPPLYYQVQFQQELHVRHMDWGSVAVLIGGQRLRYFDITRDDEFIHETLLPALDKFWTLVRSNVPPEIDGSEGTTAMLKRMHPNDNGNTVTLPDEALAHTRVIADCKEAIKNLKAEQTAAENKIKAAIGSNTFGLLPDGRLWTWKTHDRSGYTVAPGKVRALSSPNGD